MTHIPPQFRTATVLITEWRRRAAEYGASNAGAAEAYERCANELERLDVHTEGAPAGAMTRPGQMNMLRMGIGVLAAGVLIAGLAASRTPRLHPGP